MSRRKPSYPLDTNAGGGGGAPSGIYLYESPVAPQFSRWSPELYLRLDGNLTDLSPKNRAVTTFGPVPPTFANDSPFGSGLCLQVNPDGLGGFTSGLSVAANLSMQMSYSANSTGAPWSTGFWFKASAAPTVEFGLLTTSPSWAAAGKLLFINTAGQLTFNQWGSVPYNITANICDNAWHFIVVSFWPNAFGVVNVGDVYLDGARVGPMWTAYPNASSSTAATKPLGRCDDANTYLLSDFWYQNAPMDDALVTLLWNAGSGRRFNDPTTGLIELTRT